MGQPAPSDDPYGMKIVSTSHEDTYPFIDPDKGKASNITVLITGASKGIGCATAKSFARAGASGIALLARSDLNGVVAEVINAAIAAGRKEPKILTFQADISDQEAIKGVMDSVEEEFGFLDVVINNASRLETWLPLAETDVADWWKTWEVNIKGTYIVTRAAVPLVLKSQLKTILTLTSARAFISAYVHFPLSSHLQPFVEETFRSPKQRTQANTVHSPGASAYQITKMAQIRLSDFLMSEYGEKVANSSKFIAHSNLTLAWQGLIAYSIHPGGVKTDTALNMPENMHFLLTQTAELSADTIVWLTRERKEW